MQQHAQVLPPYTVLLANLVFVFFFQKDSPQQFAVALPKLSVSFSVLNEFFNELAFNPGPSKAGFLFFLDWGNHNLNSVVANSDANGPVGRSLLYFHCNILELLTGVLAGLPETPRP